jgi:UrcA family protein
MRPHTVVVRIVPLALAACSLQVDARPTVVDAEVLSKSIDYSDLDLQAPRQAAVLYRRIELAASYVCRPLMGRDVQRSIRFRKCVDEAIERAVGDVHAPLLSERYAILTSPRIVSPLPAPLNR